MVNILHQLSDHQRTSIIEIQNLLKAENAKVYLVGGCVRDSLLGLRPKDIDIEVYNTPPELIEKTLSKKFQIETVGKQFGVFILKGHSIDISIPRKESKIGISIPIFLLRATHF